MIEGVGLAIAGVAKDGEDLDSCGVPAAESVHKLRLVADLGRERGGRSGGLVMNRGWIAELSEHDVISAPADFIESRENLIESV